MYVVLNEQIKRKVNLISENLNLVVKLEARVDIEIRTF